MKRIISLMLTLAVALSLLILPAGAASTPEEALGEVNIYSGGYSMNYLAVNGRVQTQSYTYFLYRNSVGETQEILAYCVTPDQYGVPQTVPEGESIRYLAEEKASDSKVVGLVANMYPHRSLAELGLTNKYQAFYAGLAAEAEGYMRQAESQYADKNYVQAKKYYLLAKDVYAELENDSKVSEVTRKLELIEMGISEEEQAAREAEEAAKAAEEAKQQAAGESTEPAPSETSQPEAVG